MISGIIKVNIGFISRAEGQADNITETLIIPDITKTESNNCFIIHCLEINKDKYTVARNRFDIALGNYALRVQPTD